MDAVVSVVVLSHKYQMDELLTQAMSHLRDYYTSDFDEWSKLDRKTTISPTPADAVSAINIAALTQTPSILPVAFLEACLAGATVLKGAMRGGVFLDPLIYPDAERVLDGRAAVLQRTGVAVARIFNPKPSPSCRNDYQCSRMFANEEGTDVGAMF